MRPDAFKARFNVEKRELKEKQIVLHCLKGKRAFEAADKLLLLGYKNVYVYKVSNSWVSIRLKPVQAWI